MAITPLDQGVEFGLSLPLLPAWRLFFFLRFYLLGGLPNCHPEINIPIFLTGAASKLPLNLLLAGRKNYVPSVCSTSPAISFRFKKTPTKHKSVSICDSPQSSVYQNKL